jgi:hypothetical protein
MKTLTRLLKEFFLLQRFQVHAVMLLLMFSLTSCFQKFYKTNTVATTDSATLHKLVDENKTFIVHTLEGPFAIRNATVSVDVFSGEKEALNPEYDKYLNPVANNPNRLNMRKSEAVLNEVHLYTKSSFPANGKVNLDINQIYRIDVYGFDKKATRDSRTVGIIGVTVGVGAIVGVVAIAANSMDHMFEGMTINMH